LMNTLMHHCWPRSHALLLLVTCHRFPLSAYNNSFSSIAAVSIIALAATARYARHAIALIGARCSPPGFRDGHLRGASLPNLNLPIFISWELWELERLGGARHHRDHDDDTPAVFDNDFSMLRSLCLARSLSKAMRRSDKIGEPRADDGMLR